MLIGNIDLIIKQGASYSGKLTFYGDDGQLEDITGQVFAGKIKTNVTDTESVAEFTFEILNQTANKGEVLFLLSAAQTAAITVSAQRGPLKKYQEFAYDIIRTLADQSVERVAEGVAKVSPRIT